MLSGQTPEAAPRAAGVRPRTAYKWLARFKDEGAAGLADRSSRPRRLRRPTSLACAKAIIAPRRQRLCGKHIAKRAGVSLATVSRILGRGGLSRMRDLDPAELVQRYERAHPGEMIHLDIKKLGRIDGVGHRITSDRTGQINRRARSEGVGWEFAHVAIDDASRIAFVQMKPDEKAGSAVAFLKAAVAYFESLGVTVSRAMTDKVLATRPSTSATLAALRHVRTRPPRKRTGKAERFILGWREALHAQAPRWSF
jgi:transposase